MTDREKFFDTVGILVEAYLNDTLVHGDPCGCGGGNIIANKIGAKIIITDRERPTATWVNCSPNVNADGFDWLQRVKAGAVPFGNPILGEEHIKLTGYSVEQFCEIESAFESVVRVTNGKAVTVDFRLDPDGFKGLMKVCDVLAEIHNIDLEVRESAKLLFVKQ
jgi:hypothetical protein